MLQNFAIYDYTLCPLLLYFICKRYTFSVKLRKLCSKSSTFAKSFRWQSFSWNKRKCLTSCKIAKISTKNIRGTEQLIYVGCLSVLYIQVFGDTYKRTRWAAHFL